MFRSICSIASNLVTKTLGRNVYRAAPIVQSKSLYSHLSFSANTNVFGNNILSKYLNKLSQPSTAISPIQPLFIPNRTVVKFSYKKGKRKSVKTVTHRFFRLHWGGWIRTKAGRDKHMWRKTNLRKKRLKEHVFCNATQSRMLDKMVTMYWRRPKFYIDDPYAPYHNREEFPITRRKPKVRPEDLQ